MGSARKIAVCIDCNRERKIEAKGRCATCYRKARQALDPNFKQKDRHNKGTCITCQREITIVARGMCGRCYTKVRCEEDPEYAAQRKAKQDAWNEKYRGKKAAIQRAYVARNKDRLTPVKRKPVIQQETVFIPDVFCSVCDRSMNRYDYTIDCDGLQAHGVCSLVKGDRHGWKKPPYRQVG